MWESREYTPVCFKQVFGKLTAFCLTYHPGGARYETVEEMLDTIGFAHTDCIVEWID